MGPTYILVAQVWAHHAIIQNQFSQVSRHIMPSFRINSVKYPSTSCRHLESIQSSIQARATMHRSPHVRLTSSSNLFFVQFDHFECGIHGTLDVSQANHFLSAHAIHVPTSLQTCHPVSIQQSIRMHGFHSPSLGPSETPGCHFRSIIKTRVLKFNLFLLLLMTQVQIGASR